jgi:hypothetical protein
LGPGLGWIAYPGGLLRLCYHARPAAKADDCPHRQAEDLGNEQGEIERIPRRSSSRRQEAWEIGARNEARELGIPVPGHRCYPDGAPGTSLTDSPAAEGS